VTSLVYAYGCGQPLTGEEHAAAEHTRCINLWNDLVALDQEIAKRERDQCRADRPRLGRVWDGIEELTRALAERPGDRPLRARRNRLYGVARRALNRWRKHHRPWLRALDEERTRRVVAIRKAHTVDSVDPVYWGNSNRVMLSYQTGRQVARLKGRQLRFYDPENDKGVFAVQIQRTPSGLGGAAGELMAGKIPAVHISTPNARGRAQVSLRIDAAGHHLTLPIWIHRPLPERSRVKAAQLTFRRRGPRLTWRLCLTLDVTECGLFAPQRRATSGIAVEFDWAAQGYLEVMRVGGQVWRLPADWMNRVTALEARQGALDEALNAAVSPWGTDPVMGPLLALPTWAERIQQIALARPSLNETQIRWWVGARRLWLALPGERAHILGARQNLYRHWAREVVSSYAALVLPSLDLAKYAHKARGEDDNRWRHRAAIHTLRGEIVHQANKAGTPLLDASGRMINERGDDKSSAWKRRKEGKAQRSQQPSQDIDEHGSSE
jgi:hypothetical protein